MARTDFSLVIPVRNGGDLFVRCVESILRQSTLPREIIIYDTESSDGAIAIARTLIRKIPVKYKRVRRQEFDHGGTRNAALKIARMPWVLYMTQDAICADQNSFADLLAAVRHKGVVAAYGRQLPHRDAEPLAITARDFNYSKNPITQNLGAGPRLGIKTWFTSNSFCIWNRAALIRVGGFAESLIMGEDMHAAARLIQAGGTVMYEPSATVYHSHNYSAREEFQRYFDIGVFHHLHADLLFRAGNANKEGLKFVVGQARALWKFRSLWALCKLPFHVAAKFLGYKLGRNFTLFSTRIARLLSMHKSYWK